MEFCGKVCNKCKEFKTKFHKDSGKKDGLCTVCVDCKRANTKSWVDKNPERAKKNSLNCYYKNRNNVEFKSKRAEASKQWREANPHKHRAKEAKRRGQKLKATPPWLTNEQLAHMQRTYKLCAIISDATGESYHVDHIVPLQGKNICGLHVPWNLRVITAKHNLAKGNKHD